MSVSEREVPAGPSSQHSRTEASREVLHCDAFEMLGFLNKEPTADARGLAEQLTYPFLLKKAAALAAAAPDHHAPAEYCSFALDRFAQGVFVEVVGEFFEHEDHASNAGSMDDETTATEGAKPATPKAAPLRKGLARGSCVVTSLPDFCEMECTCAPAPVATDRRFLPAMEDCEDVELNRFRPALRAEIQYAAWKVFFKSAVKLILLAIPTDSMAVFWQSDVRKDAGRQCSKSYLVLRALEEVVVASYVFLRPQIQNFRDVAFSVCIFHVVFLSVCVPPTPTLSRTYQILSVLQHLGSVDLMSDSV